MIEQLLTWLRPPRVTLVPGAPGFLAQQIKRQFEDDLPTRRLKAVQA